jgi:hypothetical protein
MKHFCLNVIFAAALWLSGSAAMRAEVLTRVEFTAAFPFKAGVTVLPAGAYRILDASDQRVVMLVSESGAGSAAVLVSVDREAAPGEGPSVRFVRVNGQYVLSSVGLGNGRVVEFVTAK